MGSENGTEGVPKFIAAADFNHARLVVAQVPNPAIYCKGVVMLVERK